MMSSTLHSPYKSSQGNIEIEGVSGKITTKLTLQSESIVKNEIQAFQAKFLAGSCRDI